MKFNKNLVYILLWMSIIFILSHSSGEESSEQSGMVLKLLNYLDVKVQDEYLNIVSIAIRKTAHMTEYFILTILILRYTYDLKIKKYLLYSPIVAILYACSDEFHQTFIPGRAGMISDVFVDSIGVFLALTLWSIWLKKRKYSKNTL
ncbi:MAG: VanZ family protein [Fusobacteriaceae bacterium]